MNENEKKELGAICLFSFLLILGLGLLFFVGLGGKATFSALAFLLLLSNIDYI